MFSKLLLVLVIISFAVCIQVPVVAQEETLEDQLAEAKAAIADQTWVIEQMTDNFFKTVGELMKEIDPLKAANAEQAAIIKQISENFIEVTGELRAASAALEERVAEQAATIQKLTDNWFEATGNGGAQDATIQKITDNWFEVSATKDAQAATIQKITDNWFKVTDELRATESADVEQLATIKKLKTQRLLLGFGFLAAAYYAISSGSSS